MDDTKVKTIFVDQNGDGDVCCKDRFHANGSCVFAVLCQEDKKQLYKIEEMLIEILNRKSS